MSSQTKQEKENNKLFVAHLIFSVSMLEFLKLLLRAGGFGDLEDVEANCLTQWSTFTDGHDVTDLNIPRRRERSHMSYATDRASLPKAWAQMNRDVLVSFLETVVLADVVQKISSDDNRTCHLQLHHCAGEDTSTDAHVACEWALLVDVGTFDGLNNGLVVTTLGQGFSYLAWCLETKANVTRVAFGTAGFSCFHDSLLLVQEDGRLFLERTFLEEKGATVMSRRRVCVAGGILDPLLITLDG